MAAVRRLGETISLLARFTKAGALFDPDTVTVTVTPPRAAVSTVYTSGDPELFNDTTGEYVIDVALDRRGTWHINWLGTATILDNLGRPRDWRQPVRQRIYCYF
jgi:hypothetical protein